MKSPFHRTTAVLAGTLLGLAGAVASAAPASAHQPNISAQISCIAPDGSWTVSWNLSSEDLGAKVAEVEFSPNDSTITGIAVDDTVPKWATGDLTGVQSLPATANLASLKVTLFWDRPDRDVVVTAKGTLDKPTFVCPTASPPSGPGGVTGGSSDGYGFGGGWPEFLIDQTCNTLTVGVDNPADEPETVTLTPSVGKPRTVTVAPGKVETVNFPASEGLIVQAVPKSAPDVASTIAYKARAACDDTYRGRPTIDPPATDPPATDLPVTGVAIGAVVGGAALLLAAGGVLFVLARRRKVKFTA